MGAPPPRVLVALSGGADSVALLDALLRCGPAAAGWLAAAHLDHGLREDSQRDREFCEALCRRLGVTLHVARADVAAHARRDGCGLEAAARAERYAFLRRVAGESGASTIALAHTRDDQAETLLLRLLRGAGSDGLAGMRGRSGDLLRPLLAVSRACVLEYLGEHGLTWREDPSNQDPAFTRNRVRRELIPWLEARFNPRLRESLAGTAGLLADEAEHLDAEAEALLFEAAPEAGGWALPLQVLRDGPPALARRALRRLAQRAGSRIQRLQVERLLALARSPRGSGRELPLPGRRVARIRFQGLWLGPQARRRPFSAQLAVPGLVALPEGGELRAAPWDGRGTPEDGVALAPRGVDLTVRTRQPGDRARRSGREVSLKRLLLERRVPADRRDTLPLLANGREVLWGPGLGIDVSEPCRGEQLIRVELRPRPAATPAERG